MRLIKSAKIYSRFAEKDLRKLLNEVSKAENIQRYWNTRSLKLLAVPSLRSIISDNMSGLTLEELSSYIVRYTKAKILASSAGVFYSRSPDISIISAAAIDFDKGDTNKYFSDPGSDGMIHSWKAYDGDFNWGRDRFRSRIRSIYSLIFRACVDNGVDTCVFLPIGLGVFLPKFKFYDARIVEDVIYDYFDISFNMLENIQLETYYLNIGGPNNHPIAHKVLAKYIGREDLGDRIVLGFRHDDMTKSANNIIYQEIVNAADLFFHSDEYYIKTPIKFIHKDVVCVGQQLAIEGKKVALLNASDMIAVVQGRLGYWWETGVGDRFVGEEYLAAFTTMLTSCYNQSSQPIISVNPL
jgi:hypothetical protein